MSNALQSGRQPIQIIEIDQDYCSRAFGMSPCLATGISCYNTRQTCTYDEAYELGVPLTLRFCTSGAIIPADAGYCIPTLTKVDTTPTRTNPGGTSKGASPFGERATASISLIDAPHTGTLVDPYPQSRIGNALQISTFWAKWQARNPYYVGRAIRVKDGYVGQAFSTWRTRHYVLDNISLNVKSGAVTIKAKDALKLADNDRAVAPKPTGAVLTADINEAVDTFVASGVALADMPSDGTLRIGTEVMTYAGRTFDEPSGNMTFTGVTRGTDGTKAASHKAKDTAQLCLRYDSVMPWELAATLLTDYAGLLPEQLDDWGTEGETWLSQFGVSGLITEPVGVTTLIGELCQQVLMYIWWDEYAGLVRMSAVKPVMSPDAVITDSGHIIDGSATITEKTDQRITQCWIFYGQIDPTKKLDDAANYRSLRIQLDTDAESPAQHGDQRIFKIFSRWIDTDAKALTLASRYLSRFRSVPRLLKLSLDAKDIENCRVANVLDVQTYFIVDFEGQPLATRFEVLSVDEPVSGHRIDIEMQSTEFAGSVLVKYAYWMPDDAADYSGQSSGFWLAAADGKMPNGDNGFNWI